jgi:Cu/Ag efflux pump CusA
MTAAGAGSEVRRAMGVTVFAGMLGVTLFGLLLAPVFYVALRKLAIRIGGGRKEPTEAAHAPAE